VNEKITSDHLSRKAYLYIRQSSIRQVMEHTESTKRQYALKERAISLGWSLSDIIVIDSDLGQSGATGSHCCGFKRLVSEVGVGNAGIVLGLEVSRLARNSSDWHRLLEICAITNTLILDEDGIYDPCHFNDRLLLGLKGTMSEAEWNTKLKELAKTQEEYEQKRQQDLRILKEEDREKILSLATDFPKLWQNPNVPYKEKKRIIRLLIEDVTLFKNDHIDIHVRFKGGQIHSLTIPAPLNAWQERTTNKEVISQIDHLLNDYTDNEIAKNLNQQGKFSGTNQLFSQRIIGNIRRGYNLKSRYTRLREKNYLTLNEISSILQVSTCTIKGWAREGIIKKYRFNDKNECLYELNRTSISKKLSDPEHGKGKHHIKLVIDRINEVQYAI
jgi:DNA invertase Pin-like site-specific DNA recombinase